MASETRAAPALRPSLGPDASIDGFRIVERIHAGGTGYIYAVQAPSGRDPGFPLVMKVPAVGIGEPWIGVVAFEMELMILPALSGPHVPRFVAAGDLHTTPYLVMERIEGESLVSLLHGTPLPAEETVRLGLAIADALHSLHAQQAVTAARAQEVTAAEADLENARAGSHAVAAAKSQIATTEARVRGARADSLAAMTRLQYAELRAPVSGTVQVLTARRGELVGPGTPVAVIVDPMSLWVRVAMPETDAGGIAVGDSLTVRVATGAELRGRVISKGAEGDFATQRDVSSAKRDIRAVSLRVAIPNPRRTLVPGMTAQVLVPPAR